VFSFESVKICEALAETDAGIILALVDTRELVKLRDEITNNINSSQLLVFSMDRFWHLIQLFEIYCKITCICDLNML